MPRAKRVPRGAKAAARRYVVDTQLYIRAFRDAEANAELVRFHAAFAPFELLSAVVAQELRSGGSEPLDRGRQNRLR